MKKALMLASVASMIDKFNMENVKILKEMGYSVDVACNFEFGSITSQKRVDNFKEELINEGINVYHIPIPRSISDINNMVISYKNIKKICNDNNYQIVHCHSPIGGVLARLACKSFRKNGMRVIYTAHGFHFFDGAPKINWMMFYPIERFCARYTDCIITINKEDYCRAKNFSCKNVQYVPGIGIDVNKIKNAIVNKFEIRKEFGVDKNDFLIFSVGQTSKRKNHEVIIKALSKIKYNNIKYMICGFGELDKYLKKIAKENGVEDKVIFAGFRNDVYELLHIADLFAFPSLQEGLPVALMEAMAAGLPIVCSRIRGNVDLVEDKRGGFMYLPNDIEGFAEGIMKIYREVEIQNQMSDFNLSIIKEYDCKIINNYMKKIYKGESI